VSITRPRQEGKPHRPTRTCRSGLRARTSIETGLFARPADRVPGPGCDTSSTRLIPRPNTPFAVGTGRPTTGAGHEQATGARPARPRDGAAVGRVLVPAVRGRMGSGPGRRGGAERRIVPRGRRGGGTPGARTATPADRRRVQTAPGSAAPHSRPP